jgi:hypothetical protein
LALLGVLAVGACSRTGVRDPRRDAALSDAGPGAPTSPDTGVLPPIDGGEVPVPIPLDRPAIDAVLVIDRSGSMLRPIDASEPSGPSRWQALTDALEVGRAAIASTVRVGAELFPDERIDDGDDRARFCRTSPGLELPLALGGAAALVERMRTGPLPRGGTPTAAAMQAALASLRASRSTRRVIVLVTDGAPNCGAPSIDCTCSTTPAECAVDPFGLLCLDDDGTIASIEAAWREGIPVVVIGIDDPSRPELGAILDRMAIAGGRARPLGSPHRFHSARSSSELDAALASIGAGLSECTFIPPAGSTAPVASITVGGRTIPPGMINGWTASPVLSDAIDLHGSACSLARTAPVLAWSTTEELGSEHLGADFGHASLGAP